MELILLSVLLAIIQGLTEFLPISSSAHLLLPSLIFGFQDLGLSFDIATHVGTLTAVIYFFRKEIYSMILSLNPKSNNHDDRKLTLFLCISTIPIVLVGLLVGDQIQARLFDISTIAIANILFAGILLIAYLSNKTSKSLYQLTIASAILIGCFQIFALIPGASRSGVTITAALFVGLSLKDSAKYSFLLGIPTILGALVFLIKDLLDDGLSIDINILLIGFIVSSIIAFYTIKIFLKFVEKIGIYPFVIYRFILGLILILLLL